jgi:hypothetical protein
MKGWLGVKAVPGIGGQCWSADIEVLGKVHHIGLYEEQETAAEAYDLEALRAYGNQDCYLNFRYKSLEAAEHRLRLADSDGNEFFVDLSSDLSSYQPVCPPSCDNQWDDSLSRPSPSLPITSEGAPPRSSLIRPWLTRITTSYTPTASFCFEITFPHQNALGLSLKPKSIFYSSAGTNKFMGALVVEESQALLSTVVYPGDLLLRINDTNLANFGDDFDFETATNLITASSAPRVIRFLRPLGPDHTLSPAEVACFLSLPSSSICQSSCGGVAVPEAPLEPSDAKDAIPAEGIEGTEEEKAVEKHGQQLPYPIAKFNVVLNAATSSQSLHLMSLDSQVSPPLLDYAHGHCRLPIPSRRSCREAR